MTLQVEIRSVASLVEGLGEFQLITPDQLKKVVQAAQGKNVTPDVVLRQLVKQEWLTAYQAEQLAAGRGADLVLGTYCLLEPIGQGGMGQVFKARHRLMERVVALKVIRKELLADPEAARRFRREIRAAGQLSHPNIITAHDAEQIGDTHFLVMEYCEGQSLGRQVRQMGSLPVALACACIRQAALGLQHAFEKGLTHRDIKPENLLWTGSVVKILDLGLARLRGAEATPDPTGVRTAVGVTMGTPDYMAPEQARDARAADIRSDLYSLGCTFYFLLIGKIPFPGGNSLEKMLRHQTEEPTPVEQLRPEVAGPVAAVVRRLMAKDPAGRYQTPAAVAEALAPFAAPAVEILAAGASPVGDAPAASPTDLAPSLPVSRDETEAPAPGLPPNVVSDVPVPSAGTSPPAAVRGVASGFATDVVRVAPPEARSAWRLRWWLSATGALVGVLLLVVLLVKLAGWPEAPPPEPKPATGGPVFPVDPLPTVSFTWQRLSGVVTNGGPVQCLAFAADSRTLAAGCKSGLLKVYAVYTKEERYSLVLGKGPLYGVAFSPNHTQVATVAWLATGGKPYRSLINLNTKTAVTRQTGQAWLIAYLDAEHLLLADLDKGLLRRQDIEKSVVEDLVTFKPKCTRNQLSFSAHKKTFGGLNSGGNPQTWDLTGAKAPPPLVNPPNWIDAVALSPAGDLLAVAGKRAAAGSTELCVWSSAGGGPRPAPPRLAAEVTCLVWTPNGKQLVAGTKTGDLHLCDADTGQLVSTVAAHTGPVHCALFSPDGKLLASGGEDGLAQLWSWGG